MAPWPAPPGSRHRCPAVPPAAHSPARRRLHAPGRDLAQLDALVERIDAPDDSLDENLVLVERDQLAETGRIEGIDENDGARTIAGCTLCGATWPRRPARRRIAVPPAPRPRRGLARMLPRRPVGEAARCCSCEPASTHRAGATKSALNAAVAAEKRVLHIEPGSPIPRCPSSATPAFRRGSRAPVAFPFRAVAGRTGNRCSRWCTGTPCSPRQEGLVSQTPSNPKITGRIADGVALRKCSSIQECALEQGREAGGAYGDGDGQSHRSQAVASTHIPDPVAVPGRYAEPVHGRIVHGNRQEMPGRWPLPAGGRRTSAAPPPH